MNEPIELDGVRTVSINTLESVARHNTPIQLAPSVPDHLSRSRDLLQIQLQARKLIYGVTTGYGPLANTHIAPERAHQLQKNLVYHLATGVGPFLSTEQCRAIVMARLINMLRSYSAVRPSTANLLVQCLNAGITPAIPALGTVGASGDLTLLAHMTLVFMGEGECWVGDGPLQASQQALHNAGITPLKLTHKEGLALVNGTSAMTGMAALNDALARRLTQWNLRLAVLYAEVLSARQEAWDPLLGHVRPHPGQQHIHDQLAELLQGNHRLRSPEQEAPLHPQTSTQGTVPNLETMQDPYTLRCVPQIFGAIEEMLVFHHRIVETELNSVTDNPIFDPEKERVIHGGNFYGQHVAFASDTLNMAVIKLAQWSPSSTTLVRWVREHVPLLTQDRPMRRDIMHTAQRLCIDDP